MGWPMVPASRANPRPLEQGIALRCKNPAMAATAAGVSNRGWTYWHGGSLTAVALLHLCEKGLLDFLKLFRHQRTGSVQCEQSLQFFYVISVWPRWLDWYGWQAADCGLGRHGAMVLVPANARSNPPQRRDARVNAIEHAGQYK